MANSDLITHLELRPAICEMQRQNGETYTDIFWIRQLQNENWIVWCPDLGEYQIIEALKSEILTVTYLPQNHGRD